MDTIVRIFLTAFALLASSALHQYFCSAHQISVRQTTLAPYFPQQSYTFQSSCYAGSLIGTISATSLTGGAITYSADPTTGSSSYVQVSPYTGQITMLATPSGAFSFTFRATSFGGSAAVPVTVYCTGASNPTNTIGSPTFSQPSYTLTASSCTPGAVIGQVYAANAVSYQISGGTNIFTISQTGAVTLTGYPTSGTYSATVQAYGYNGIPATAYLTVTVTCNGGYGVPTFTQPSYSFTVSSCTTGSPVGSIYAANAISYIMSGGNNMFSIGTNGLITLTGYPTPGTYSATVQAYGATGLTATAYVTVTISCNGGFPGFPGGVGSVTFPQSSYTFTASSCTPGAQIGSVYAANGISYILSGGSSVFSISPTGIITLTGYPTSGTYSATVQAYGSTGGTATAYVTVTVNCNGLFPGGTGGVTFSQSSYSFSSAPSGTGLCINPGAVIGNIYATGAYSYAVTSGPTGLFTISPSGQISLATAATAGTYSLTVTAYGSAGSASVPVTISIPCNIIRRAPEWSTTTTTTRRRFVDNRDNRRRIS